MCQASCYYDYTYSTYLGSIPSLSHSLNLPSLSNSLFLSLYFTKPFFSTFPVFHLNQFDPLPNLILSLVAPTISRLFFYPPLPYLKHDFSIFMISQRYFIRTPLTYLLPTTCSLSPCSADFVFPTQCDQIGRFIGLWASF